MIRSAVSPGAECPPSPAAATQPPFGKDRIALCAGGSAWPTPATWPRQLKQQHKIDVVVALSMAALAAIKGQSESSYDINNFLDDDDEEPKPPVLFPPSFASLQEYEDYKQRMRAQFGRAVSFPYG